MIRTHVDLFTGIGGFALAAQANDVQTIAMCEIDDNCRAFLSKAWPEVEEIHDDVRTFDAVRYAGAWLVTGGVPCQPASRAGKQRGSADNRWLWPDAIRVVSDIRPAWCLLENPPGIGDVGLAGVLSDLEGVGYQVRVVGIPACAVGAPHRRERYWIVGHRAVASATARIRQCEPGQQGARPGAAHEAGPFGELARPTTVNAGVGLADANSTRREGADTKPGAHGLRAEHHQGDSMADAGRIGGWQDEPQRGQAGRDADGRDRALDVADTEGFTGLGWAGPVHQGRARQRRHSDTYGAGLWSRFVWVPCADGKFRRAPDDAFGLVDGLHRSLLAALGNSIVPAVAERIIAAMIAAEVAP